MSYPLVTLGIAAFNAVDTIERAVHSAFAQYWKPVEVVVVDDGSSDGTYQLLCALVSRYPDLRIIRHERNKGVAVVRNSILREAKGEFIAFFDDDDESLPDRVGVQVQRIVDYEQDFADGAPVICHTARRLMYPDGTNVIAQTMGEPEGRLAPSGYLVAKRILLGAPVPFGYGACATCSQMARVEVYKALGGFDPAFRRSEDTDFNIRLAKMGGHFVGIARPLVRQTMTKASEKSLSEEYRQLIAMVEKHRDVADAAHQYHFCRNWVEAKQAWLKRRHWAFGLKLLQLLMINPILTVQRTVLAFHNVELNRSYRRFYSSKH